MRAGSPARKQRLADAAATALQVLAILALAAIFLVLLHKAYTDVTSIAHSHGRGNFWPALLRYLFRNLAGG